MPGGTTARTSPRGLQRLFLRLPIALYHWGIGGMLGKRFLLLTHTGRKSGQIRQTMLEVVSHDRERSAYIVASGWGKQAQWFQNVMQHAMVTIQVGHHQMAAQATQLSDEQATTTLSAYALRHPRAFRTLSRMMVGRALTADIADCALLAAEVPLIALTYQPVGELSDARDNQAQSSPSDIPHVQVQTAAQSELAEYLDRTQQRRRIFPRAALVGFLAGMMAIVFRSLLSLGDIARINLITWAHQSPSIGWLVPMIGSAAGAILALALVRAYAPETSGSGIPHIEMVLHRLSDLRWRHILPVKLFGGTIAMGSGLALGREGPTVQMGGAIGAMVAEWLGAPTQERLTLIAAGAGAGLAAAFNAPLSGLVFVLEEVQRDFRPLVFGATFIAAAIADILARLTVGQLPVFAIPSYPVPSLTALPTFAILGIVTGLLGVFFNRSLLATMKLFGHFNKRTKLLGAGFVGATIGLVGWFAPEVIGGGHSLTETTLVGGVMLAAIPLLFLLRFGLTLMSYATGAPGGIFAPLLVLGALIGLSVGDVAHVIAPLAVPQPAVFAVVGMAAYFTAIVRAPLTGIVLVIEMTGNYNLMLPLLVACFGAYAVAEGLRDLPIYEALLQRDLLLKGKHHILQAPMVLDIEVEPGASFSGKTIRQIGLPPGCIIVRCRDGGREWVPTASTQLGPHIRITVMIAPDAVDGLRILRHGCTREHRS